MTSSVPLIVRLLASSVSVAGRAGKIVRDVMSKGELGIVEKVCSTYFLSHWFYMSFIHCCNSANAMNEEVPNL